MNKACPSCGSEVQDGMAFCPHCGTAVLPIASPDPGTPISSAPGGKCPFCLAAVEEVDQSVGCHACGVAHHADCWSDAGGCAVVGCSGASTPTTGSVPTSFPPPVEVGSPVSTAPAPGFGSAPAAWPPAPAESTPGPNKRKLVGLGVAGILAALLAGGVALAAAGGESHTVTGQMTVVDISDYLYLDDGDSCRGMGGYSDIRGGTQVTLESGEGTSLATGYLSPGYYDSDEYGCVFEFSLEDVPKADFYRLEISHRGTLTYSYEEMVSNGWEVNPTLGS